MRKAKVLFFAADPLARGYNAQHALQLAKEFRAIKERASSAKYREVLDLDYRPDARPEDLIKALPRTSAQVLHFSGHGGDNGLVMGDRVVHRVGGQALAQLFEAFPSSIRLVVLSACFSRPEAEAVVNVVGCAIGTRDAISDDAAIRFNEEFYHSIASGDSVQTAFNKAKAALAMYGKDQECPELLVRPGVDPSRLILIPRFSRPHQAGAAVAVFASALAALLLYFDPPVRSALQLGDCEWAAGTVLRAAPLPSTADEALEEGKRSCREGDYEAAVARFEESAREGNPEAKGFLGIAYMSGEGVKPDTQVAIAYLREAATRKRDPRAMYAYGVAYLNGDGLRQSNYYARIWVENAAKSEFPLAMRTLANFYRRGISFTQSDSAADYWTARADSAGAPKLVSLDASDRKR